MGADFDQCACLRHRQSAAENIADADGRHFFSNLSEDVFQLIDWIHGFPHYLALYISNERQNSSCRASKTATEEYGAA